MKLANKIRQDEIGARVRAFRVASRMTQETVATALGMSRTTLVAIEAGRRAISSGELRKIAKLFDVDEGELLDLERPMLELAVAFRRNVAEVESTEEVTVAAMLNRLARSVVQLETLVGFPRPLDMPGVMLSRDQPLEQQAEDAALALRARLGLGIGPIQDLNGLMESELDVRIFERLLPSNVSGAMAFSDAAGGFVLLNANHPIYCRRVTAAHGLAHILLRQQGIRVQFSHEAFDSREEKFYDVFAACFLMPATAVRKKFNELKIIVGKLAVRELLTMTLYFNVSLEALVSRLVALSLFSKGTYERLNADGVGLRHQDIVRDELGLSPEPPAFTARTMLLAMAAHKKELLSEQQIASMLELDLVSVRRALEDHGESERESTLELVP